MNRPATCALGLVPALMLAPAAAASLTDKTLVAWVSPANLGQRGGSALTIQDGDRFDAIVFGERAPGKWMAGSDYFRRTQKDPDANAAEAASPETLVQLAIVYEGDDIRIYRNGEAYAAYKAENVDLLHAEKHIAVFGLRHVGAGSGTPFAGTIEDARIYARALTVEQIRTLRANEPSEIKPLAWWDFADDAARDRTGHFTHHAVAGEAKLKDGRLVLDGKGYLVAARSEQDAKQAMQQATPAPPAGPYVPETPSWPDPPPANWLTFHLAHPGPGQAYPGDPNCIFDYKGRVHLHYIYRNAWGFAFAHVSSADMVHWQWHKTVLAPPTTGHGMFSGTGFRTKDGRPAIIYHGQGSGRNWIQVALDDQLDSWSEPKAVIPRTESNQSPEMRHWDPDCWLNGDTYYALSGGGTPQLMKSADLENWAYLGDLLHPDYPTDLGVPKGEDISCANMFRIGNRWMLLCISHPLGCRYYLGDFKDEKYLPEFHAMMNWQKAGKYGFYFAPESVLTRDGRRVMWAWLFQGMAPSGVQSLPRELELPADGILRIKPLRELQTLRYEPRDWSGLTVNADTEYALGEIRGDALELEITFATPLPAECGIHLLGDAENREGMSIVAGPNRTTLRIGTIEPPFTLRGDEALTLRVYLDKNLVEVFANDRQAAAYVHEHTRENPNIRLFAKGGDATMHSVKAWRMHTIHKPAPAVE